MRISGVIAARSRSCANRRITLAGLLARQHSRPAPEDRTARPGKADRRSHRRRILWSTGAVVLLVLCAAGPAAARRVNEGRRLSAGLRPWTARAIFGPAALNESSGAAQLAPPATGQNGNNEVLQREQIAPHSSGPSGTRPYSVCAPPTEQRFSCLSVAVPAKLAASRKSSLGGPRLGGSGELGGYSPADLRSAYNLSAEGGKGLTVAITIAYDYPNAESDLATYRKTYGLPACTSTSGCFEKVNQEGKTENYPQPSSGWGAEAALDLDTVSATCPGCRILLVEANDNTLANLSLAVDTAAALGANVISDSWGGEESPEETLLDSHLKHPGIPVLFASGDSSYGAEYPASSPEVIAVGGTSLRKDQSTRGWRETAWEEAGSGCSEYEEKPAWQTDAGCSKRTVADVSAVADPETPVSVYDTYGLYEGWELFGGTSVATPLVAGVEAHSSAADRSKGAELFWQEGPEGKLYDITEGRNGSCRPEPEYLCQAKLGYDGPTGWGSPGAPGRPAPPVVGTYDPTGVTVSQATINGAINPNGEATTYHFEYGPTSAYGTSLPVPSASAGSGTGPVEVARQLSGLEQDATYHYRLVASNGLGTTLGGDHTFITSPWAAQYMPRKPQREEMFGVSCGSASSCVSVGEQLVRFEGPAANGEPLVERWGGSEWVRESVPVFHRPDNGYASRLEAVSCSSPDACMAVGENYEIHVGYGPLVERWDGKQWSIVPAPLPSGATLNENGTYEARLHGISCASATSCVLVGEFTKSWNGEAPNEIGTLVESWDGGKWTVQASSNPPEGKQNLLWGVSCASATSCVAVGESRKAGGATSTLIERWDGAKWSIDSAPSLSGGLRGVSCSSESACITVGDSVAEAWNGSDWTGSALEHPMRGVSCLASGSCLAVGGQLSSNKAYAELWNGTEWVAEKLVRPTDASDEPMEMNGVSCVSSGCAAVGWYWSWGWAPLAERRRLAPAAATEPASLEAPAVSLRATVNPNGEDTRYQFEYDTTEYKPGEGPHGASVPVEPADVGAGLSDLEVGQRVNGLLSHTTYHFRIVASNAGGTTSGSDQAFTLSDPPSVENNPVGTVTQTTAVLHDHVNSEGAAGGSSCKFVIARRSAPGTPVAEPACAPNPVTGSTPVGVEATASSLSANTQYVYRVLASSVGGTSTGTPDQEFATLPGLLPGAARLIPLGHLAPVASFSVASAHPTAGEPVAFDGSGSSDPVGTIASYAWSFGDGGSASGEQASHLYTKAGVYKVELTVTALGGRTSSTELTVTVAQPNNTVRVVGVTQNRNGSVSLRIVVPGPGTLGLRSAGAFSRVRARAGKGPKTLVRRASTTVRGAVTVTLEVVPTKSGRGRLTTKHRLSVRVSITFTPTDGTARTIGRTLALRLRAKVRATKPAARR